MKLLHLCLALSVPALNMAEGARSLQDPLPAASALWASGPAAQLGLQINRHNAAVGQDQRILYVFYPAGELNFDGPVARLAWDPAFSQDLAERLAGGVRVLPWLRLRGRAAADPGAAARELAVALGRDRRLAGLYLDGESPLLRSLLNALRPLTDKPLFARYMPLEPGVPEGADVLVLPPSRNGFGALVRTALRAGAQAKLKVLVGLSASAPDEPWKAQLSALKDRVRFDDPAYLGGALCCLGLGPVKELPGPELDAPGPFSAERWQRLTLPLVAP